MNLSLSQIPQDQQTPHSTTLLGETNNHHGGANESINQRMMTEIDEEQKEEPSTPSKRSVVNDLLHQQDSQSSFQPNEEVKVSANNRRTVSRHISIQSNITLS